MEVRESSAAYNVSMGVRQTEVGLIPADWVVTPVKQISDPVRGGSPRPAGDPRFFNGDFVPWLTVASLTNVPQSQLVISETATSLTEEGANYSRTLQPGTLIIANSGATLGVAKILGITCCANDGIAALLRIDKNICPEYLAHFINTQTKTLREVVATGNGQPNLNTGLIGELKFPLPPTLDEQQAIAEALSDADALIESLSVLLAKKRQIKQGVMQELLTGKKRLPGFSEPWEAKVLGQCASLKARIGWQGLTTKEYLDSGDYYLVTGTELHGGEIDWDECNHVDAARYKQDVNIQLQVDDVLVTKDGSIGKVGIVTTLPKPATLNSGVFVIRPAAREFDPKFFYYLLCSNVFTDFLEQLAAGSTINHLYQKDFVKFVFHLPPTENEQQAIANVLTDIDADISETRQKLTKARQLKKAMMRELLTGRIRLRQAHHRRPPGMGG
ncbi:restriction endonuclease subunit S [Burkholderia cepacia]|uniref:restriction endonuclease subunit S n=1 Tax=Burkholderia cepacia TaxID=292 RepID=UPI000F59111B|nr:restriction endonuclease subunit S [Burkholderia cepacia]RQT42501.1 restriction endonuclease subunit S [Burkholderia cepacia]